MLKKIFQSKEDKVRERVEEYLAEGMRLLSEKFYNGALIEFDKAMELSPEEVYPRLAEELDNAARSGELESALAIGLNLIKEKNRDYELANRLGNYARELKDYKRADALYKTALKIKKNYENAFYNLAASTAKVNVFDDAVKNSLSIFDGVDGFILPEYQEGSETMEELEERILERKREEGRETVANLTDERKQKLETGYPTEAAEIALEIQKVKDSMGKVFPEEVIEECKKKRAEDPENEKIYQYNMTLYALIRNMPNAAIEGLRGMSSADFDTVDLLRAIALFESGKADEAIGKLVNLLGQNEYNRYCNVNLGLMYRKVGKKFLATKYLIKTASLLEKSNGIYSMADLVDLANGLFDEGNYKKALNYFLIASTEIPDADTWYKIGCIYIERKKYDEAISAFRSLLEIDPKSKIGEEKLLDIHNYYFEKGKDLLENRKFKPAEDYMLKALSVLRRLETLKHLIIIYRQMNNIEKERAVQEEVQEIEAENHRRQLEEKRLKLIVAGKEYLKKKNYLKAIDVFESVLRMKVDKNIFIQLAALYKGLKKHTDLQSLVQRWEKMVEHEEKMRKFQKEKDREKSGKDDA